MLQRVGVREREEIVLQRVGTREREETVLWVRA